MIGGENTQAHVHTYCMCLFYQQLTGSRGRFPKVASGFSVAAERQWKSPLSIIVTLRFSTHPCSHSVINSWRASKRTNSSPHRVAASANNSGKRASRDLAIAQVEG